MTTTDTAAPPTGRVLMYPQFAARIAELGVKQGDLADAVGCARTTIGAVVRGSIIPSKALRARLAVALESDETELFELHPAVERLLAQATEQGVARGAVEPQTLRRIALIVNSSASERPGVATGP